MKTQMRAFLKGCLILLVVAQSTALRAQQIMSDDDFLYLEGLTKAVVDSSRIHSGQRLPDPFGVNNTGGTLIRPGGRETYPAFWIRDYAMTLETGWVTLEEQKHMLWLTAATQCDQSWITKGGSYVPYGAIADHIRVDDSMPIYFPGTYDYEEQGTEEFGRMPPYCDQFYFVFMAHYYWQETNDVKFLKNEINGIRLSDRLEIAFAIPPSRADNGIVYTVDNYRGKDFGFRDAIRITGELCYSSILKYRAAWQLAELFDAMEDKEKAHSYRQIARKIKQALVPTFMNEEGMLRASTGKSGQADVWGTALAIYLGVMEDDDARKAGKHLAAAYAAGNLAYKGGIRHVIRGEDFSSQTAWEDAIVPVDTYQNGAYWGTPVGWVINAIANVDPGAAARLTREYVDELREGDFRKGSQFSGPYECYSPSGYTRGPVYMTSVSAPYIALRKLREIQ
ncbi:hypothetical protein [Parapedobacter sp.]